MKRRGIVAVTGASAGIGRACVREFAKNGYDVGLIARGLDGLEAAKSEVESCGRRALVLPVDVADAAAVEQAAGRIEDVLGPIDVWVNVAFSNVFGEFLELTPAEYRRITEVTYLGYVYGTMAALSRMRTRERGTIVQVGSALCYRSIPLQSAYCGAKAAIRGFTDSIRCELRHHRSRVKITMVHMPAVNTPQFKWCRSRLPRKAQPVPPIYQPEVAARAVYWASQRRPRELWVGGSTVQAIVAQRLIPGFLDRYLGDTGYESQQYDGAENHARPDNLDHPLPGDWGAHGDFDRRARSRSLELFAATHLPVLAGALAGAVGLAGALRAAAKRTQR